MRPGSDIFRPVMLLVVSLACLFIVPDISMARDVTVEAAAARRAGVPETALNRVLVLGVDHCIGSEFMARFLNILQAAAEEKIPVTPFVDKIEEGSIKRVMPERIITALTTKLDHYRFAQELVVRHIRPRPGTFSPQDLVPLGESLDLGLSGKALESFVTGAPPTPLPMFLVGVEDLALLNQIGFDLSRARGLLFSGLSKRILDKSWRSLPEAVAAARAKGLDDKSITWIVSQVIEGKGTADEAWKALGLNPKTVSPGRDRP